MSILKTIKAFFGGTPSQEKSKSKEQHTRSEQPKHRSSSKPYQKKKRTHHKHKEHQQSFKDRSSKHSHPSRKEKPAEKPKPKKPQKPFKDMDLVPELLQKLQDNGFTHATEIQEKSIPEVLKGQNMFCSSETGSGKTLSFLIPMIQKLHTKEIHQALVVCPTREIAIQIHKNFQLLADESMTSALVIGGTNVHRQKEELRQYPQVLFATPGRLIDMLNTGLIWLAHTGYVVLDEADRMLDMGFEEDLTEIHNQLTGPHQTVLFSATLFPEVKKMAKKYANEYKEIVIGNPAKVATSVTHVLVEVRPEEKIEALKYLIKRNPGKMMVFFNTIKDTINFTRKLSYRGGPEIDCIHSKISQQDRERIIEEFRGTETDILFASDVASRGIDVPNVELVVNFDIPFNSEEYIHRVGRTGRAGKTGMAISLYAQRDRKKLASVEKLIKGKLERRKSYKGII